MKDVNKKAMAYWLGISRSTLYYRPKQPDKDWKLKIQIEEALHYHPSYGHKRLAIHLKRNKKAVLRVMNKFGIKPYKRRKKPDYKANKEDLSDKYPNLLLIENIFPKGKSHIWACDFTYLPFKGRFVYLATVIDLFTREIVGFNILTSHNNQLVMNALLHAVSNHSLPEILHQDQGREYTSKDYLNLTKALGIKTSLSRKGSPWENGYQEGFYSQFKVDLGQTNQYDNLGKLVYNICRTIYDYNNNRIHSELKMPPAIFAERLKIQRSECVNCV